MRAKLRGLLVLLTLSVATFSASAVAAVVVGRTVGAFDVSQDGEAMYSIPLVTPPGTNGMTPNLGFVYGHRDSSTLLGAGWSISGLSAIARCPMIYAADGQVRNVRNDYSDRFCLNGNKLRLVSGTYGNADATYQTEIETFSRIASYGHTGNGPSYFIVESKDGLIYEYGITLDSRIESLNQTTVRSWALNRIRDRSGNEINFFYAEDATNGAYRIEWIRYTANPNQGLSSPYEIDFVWETKPTNEIDSGYVAGSLVKQITRLDRVDVKYNTTIVRRYELTYEDALSSTSKSRLASIQECAGPTPDCFPATTFTYQNGTVGLGGEASLGAYTLTRPWPLDVNGDGREDLVYSSNSSPGLGAWLVRLANSSGGYDAPINTGVTNTNFIGAIPIDYNADGLEDLLVPYSGGTWWVMYGSASGLSAPSNTGAPATGTGADARAFDVNGDGLDDLVWADLFGYGGGDTVRYRLREWGGAFSSTVSTLVAAFPPDSRIESGVFGLPGRTGPRLVPDFNGDGKGDFVVRETDRVLNEETGQYTFFRYLMLLCPGAPCAVIPNPNAAGVPTHGDFNGDGKSDLLYLAQSGGLIARFGTGTGLTGPVTVGGGLTGWAVLDWDGDGFDDVLTESGGVWEVRRSTSEGFAAAVSTGVTTAGAGVVTIADGNGDGLYDLIHLVGSDVRYRAHAGNYPDLLLTATDGFGNSSTFSYAPLTNYGSYYKQTGATFPTQEYVGPLYVVSNVASSNGIGGTYNLQSFYYEGARLNLQGRGFLGFSFRSWIDSRDGTAQRRSYRQDFPYIGAVTNARRTQQPSGTAITEVQTTYSTHSYGTGYETRSFPFASTVTSYDRELNGALIRTTVTTAAVDSATGTPTTQTTTVTEADTGNGLSPGAIHTSVVSHTQLFNDFVYWCIGRPSATQHSNGHTLPGGTQITRTSSTSWDGGNCRPMESIVEPGNAQWQVKTTYGYDAFGNVNALTVTPAAGQGQSARTTSISWGSDGRAPRTVTNPKGHVTQLRWDFEAAIAGCPAAATALGELHCVTDPNLLTTRLDYDSFGRLTRTQRSDGTATDYVLGACNAGNSFCGVSDLRSYVQIISRDTGNLALRTDSQYFDGFDRQRYDYQQMLTGGQSAVITTYDALGRVSSQSVPFAAGDPIKYTSYAHDLLNRVTQITRQTSELDTSDSVTTIAYQGLGTITTDPLNHSSTAVHNAIGQAVQVIDALNNDTDYEYDAFGNLLKTRDFYGNEITLTYNVRGMKMSSNDPDMGYWTYNYYPLGELKTQTDAKSQTVTFAYDDLSRPLTRVEPEGTTTWTWDTAAHGIGSLAAVTSGAYGESYTYDDYGRTQTHSTNIDGWTYTYNYGYHATQGMLETIEYPANVGTRFKIQYQYQNGHVLSVRDFYSPNTVFWQAVGTDARHNVIDESFGNGLVTNRTYDRISGLLDRIDSGFSAGSGQQQLQYTWDKVGNLVKREDLNQGTLNETFEYDALDRLDIVRRNGMVTLDMAYDAIGNITSRTGVGNYTYHPTKKHAVTNAGGATYVYDANGNMTTRNGWNTTWYSYNLPKRIEYAGRYAYLQYGPDRQRYKQDHIIYPGSYGSSRTTLYVQGLYELANVALSDGNSDETFYRHYIVVDGRRVASHVRYKYSTPGYSYNTSWTAYATADHLGSMDSIYEMDQAPSTTPEARYSSEAFGKRRDWDWLGAPAQNDLTAAWFDFSNRGFTDHEQLDGVDGLIHMNGRVYDPIIGRFMSPDPFVQAPYFSQSLNRYSYVFNNPLAYIDPSGFQAKSPIKPINPNEPPKEPTPPRERQPLDATFENFWAEHFSGVTGRTAGTGGDHVVFGSARRRVSPAPVAVPGPPAESTVSGSDTTSWWNRESTVTFCGRVCAAAWDGDPNSQFAPRENTATNGERTMNAVNAMTVVVPVEGLAAKGTTFVIGKLANLGAVRAGEQTLLKWLPDLGSAAANWKQNSGMLRQIMSLGRPIRDATVDAMGRLINNTGFLRAERFLLENRGWRYDPATTMWYPPGTL